MSSEPSPPSIEDVLAHSKWIHEVALSIVGDQLVDENVQETLLRAIRNPPRHASNIRGWLGTISRNIAREQYRKESEREKWLVRKAEREFDEVEHAPTPAEVLSRSEAHQAILSVINRLDEFDRVLVLSHHQEGMSIAQVAAQNHISEPAARNRIKRAVERCRELLQRDFGFEGLLPCIVLLPGTPAFAPLVEASAAAGATAAVTSETAKHSWTGLLPLAAVASVVAVALSMLFESPVEAEFLQQSASTVGTLVADAATEEETPRQRLVADPLPAAPRLAGSQIFRVRDGDGRPVRDAVVVLGDYQKVPAGWRGSTVPREELDPQLIQLPCNEFGEARWDYPAGTEITHFTVIREGSLPYGRKTVHYANDGATQEIPVVLQAAAWMQGQVVDTYGQPVPYAKVRVFRAPSLDAQELGMAQADPQGHFLVEALPPGGPYALRVSAPRADCCWLPAPQLASGLQDIEAVVLPAGTAFAGVVLGTDGQPVEGAQVYAASPESFYEGEFDIDRGNAEPKLLTDASGSFRFDSLQEDTRLWIQASGYQQFHSQPIRELRLGQNLFELQPVQPALLLELRSPFGSPECATVSFQRTVETGYSKEHTIVANANGQFPVPFNSRDVDGSYTLSVATEYGYAVGVPFELPYHAGPKVIDLQEGVPVALRFEDPSGAPWAGLDITLESKSADFAQSVSAKAISAADGGVRFRLPPGEYQVQGLARDLMQAPFSSSIEVESSAVSRTFQAAAQQFSLLVADSGQRALAERMIEVFDGNDPDLKLPFMTDAIGQLRMLRLGEQMHARVTGGVGEPEALPYAEAAVQEDPTQAGASSVSFPTLLDLQVTVDLPADFGAVEGVQLLGDRDSKLGDGWRTFAGSPSLTPIKDGQARFELLPPGQYWAVLPRLGNRPAHGVQVDLHAGSRSVLLRPEGQPLAGQLTAAGSALPRGLTVELIAAPTSSSRPGSSVLARAAVQADGRFRFAWVPAGDWWLRLAPGSSWSSTPLPLAQALTADGELQLQLEKGAYLTAQVSPAIGKKLRAQEGVRMATLAVRHRESGSWFAFELEQDAPTAGLNGLPGGSYEVWVRGELRPDLAIELAAGESGQLTLKR